MSGLHVNRSRAEHDSSCDERVRPRWCFRCCKRSEGTHQLMREPADSYYDHWWRYRCDGCGEDHRHFPGCEPDGR
jgi:hypothetical protein